MTSQVYRLLRPREAGGYMIANREYKGGTALKAAKKAFRDNKKLKRVHMLCVAEKRVYVFSTASFFTRKKDFQMER